MRDLPLDQDLLEEFSRDLRWVEESIVSILYIEHSELPTFSGLESSESWLT